MLLAVTLPGRVAGQEAFAPVDTLTREMLAWSGHRSLGELIQTLYPAFQATFPAAAGGAEQLPPFRLFGSGADQALVLVNGRRRLPSPLLPGGEVAGRGQPISDLDAIPLLAIERIEITRGSAARFGDGAVGAVINIVLADSLADALHGTAGLSSGGDPSARAGATRTARLAGAQAALTVELGFQGAGNSARPDPRSQYFSGDPRNEDPAVRDRVTSRYGEPGVREGRAAVQLGRRLGRSTSAYGEAVWSRRSGESGERFRIAADDRTVRTLYPDGFLPLLRPRFTEGSLLGGLRGGALGDALGWDAWVGYARSSVRLLVDETANASLGPVSPVRFESGTLRADQFSAGLNARGHWRAGPLPLWLDAGVEYRSDGFEQQPGEPDSYRHGGVPVLDGPNTGRPTEPGAQGLPGIRPEEAVIARRGSLSGFAGFAIEPVRRVSLGATGRLVHSGRGGTDG